MRERVKLLKAVRGTPPRSSLRIAAIVASRTQPEKERQDTTTRKKGEKKKKQKRDRTMHPSLQLRKKNRSQNNIMKKDPEAEV